MSPSMPGRYQSMQRPQQLEPGQIPAGGPPSFTGGTPSGSQPMNAGQQQQRMPAPWTAPGAEGNPDQPMGDGMSPAMHGIGGDPQGMPGQAPNQQNQMQAQKMPAPYTPPASPMGGAPGPMQRHQMSAPQAPASPLTQRQNQQNDQNKGF